MTGSSARAAGAIRRWLDRPAALDRALAGGVVAWLARRKRAALARRRARRRLAADALRRVAAQRRGELPARARRARASAAASVSRSVSPTACRGSSERLTDSTLQMIRNIPHLALIPLVILWFGIEEEAKLFLVALGVFFPVYANTLHGVRTVDPQLIEMARSYGMSRVELFRRVILPGALPSIFVGLRYALGMMWLTLIVAETIAAQSGIGYMAMQAREFMLIDVVVLSILIYALLGKLADATARALERRCLSWHPAFQQE